MFFLATSKNADRHRFLIKAKDLQEFSIKLEDSMNAISSSISGNEITLKGLDQIMSMEDEIDPDTPLKGLLEMNPIVFNEDATEVFKFKELNSLEDVFEEGRYCHYLEPSYD